MTEAQDNSSEAHLSHPLFDGGPPLNDALEQLTVFAAIDSF